MHARADLRRRCGIGQRADDETVGDDAGPVVMAGERPQPLDHGTEIGFHRDPARLQDFPRPRAAEIDAQPRQISMGGIGNTGGLGGREARD